MAIIQLRPLHPETDFPRIAKLSDLVDHEPMLAFNHKLGYQSEPGIYVLV